jgi:ubiquinone/menaquinone biosynthesis C-methylase UbiE
MSYDEQKNFFETAYNTGSDLWTDTYAHANILHLVSTLPKNSLILDLGTGRGRMAFAMVELHMRGIGLDYIERLAEVNNAEAHAKHFDGQIKFVTGNALDIGFADGSFDAVTDFGMLHHLLPDDWFQYRSEVSRVLKSGGYIISVVLSKETEHFYEFMPKDSTDSDFEKYGVHYHFFTAEELANVYGNDFKILKQETIHLEKERENLLITVLAKN